MTPASSSSTDTGIRWTFKKAVTQQTHSANVVKVQIVTKFSSSQFDENIRLIIRRYDQANSEPEKSPSGEGRSLKPETPEPDGDSNQERAKDRGEDRTGVGMEQTEM